MDTRNGDIYTSEEIEQMEKRVKEFGLLTKQVTAEESILKNLIEMKVSPTEEQLKNKKVGRNDPCPCGSGKKFKKCCLAR